MEEKEFKRKKLCFMASSGGHLEQLLMLKPLMDRHDSFIVTEKTQYRANFGDRKVYFLKQINRKEWAFPFLMIANTVSSIRIMIREKPDAVITTGVLAVLPMCLIAKLCRKKVIYIETFAKVWSPTMMGKLMYKFADQFYVQWESMLKVYPNAVYGGWIF